MKKGIPFSALVSILLFARCNSSIDTDLLPPNIPIQISMEVTEDRVFTRAPVSIINSGNISSVGIYGITESNTSGVFPWVASPLLSNLSPATYNSGQVNFSPAVYYPDGGKRLMFYGYYPKTTDTSGNNYITAPGNGVAPVYNFTLTGQEDIMYATSTPFGSNTPGTPTLAFNHKLTQIILDTSILGLLKSIKLKDVKNKGAMDLGTGVISYSNSIIDIPLTISNNKTATVMVPADIDKYKIEVTLLILPLTYYIRPTSGNFLPGKIYTIQLPLL